ncbi:unnamed protein product [Adineta ricciae]|uniref:Uncharacterized protein n=1 Tax=Adineta ricciae TaxID=249248 RepID=A0A815HHC7_ADIRI|nr:unnamed protein product [Adineta ricciae]CAF1410493.1 unnamed protein product [Adineta ricciae]
MTREDGRSDEESQSEGKKVHQFNCAFYIFSVVDGRSDRGSNLNQLSSSRGIVVDDFDHIYIADSDNHPMMRWRKRKGEGVVIIGGHGLRKEPNQLVEPDKLSLDGRGHRYVCDCKPSRAGRFDLIC